VVPLSCEFIICFSFAEIFFLEHAGELRIIALKRKKGTLTKHHTHPKGNYKSPSFAPVKEKDMTAT